MPGKGVNQNVSKMLEKRQNFYTHPKKGLIYLFFYQLF